MKKALLAIFSFLLALTLLSDTSFAQSRAKPKAPIKERKLYAAKDSTEATLTFNGIVELTSRQAPSTSEAREHIEYQLTHLFGPMGEAVYKAVPRGNHKISDIKVEKKSASSYLISYKYTGTIVVKNGPISKYDVIVPANPANIYLAGMSGNRNPCTDHHYQDEGDFWYFWNPANPGCKLVKGKDYLVISGTIKREPNTKVTYPEYERLVDDKGQITISLLMGMDDPNKNRDPNKSNDINAHNFRDIKQTLLELGYDSREWTVSEIKQIAKDGVGNGVYVEEFVKSMTHSSTGKTTRVVMRIFFGPSGIDEDSSAFHYFYKDAMENHSVMMYDGHSGLGGHLDLTAIEQSIGKLRPNQNRYQIYYFNSCTSYTYYNTMYFARKKTAQDPNGTKNLDIFTNGLATYFSVMHDTNMALLRAIEAFAAGKGKISYQSLAKTIDSDNLFGVNGDEDNPTR